jgi:hypothetical protein
MISIETDELGPGVTMTSALFEAIAKVEALYPEADLYVSFEDDLGPDGEVWHITTSCRDGVDLRYVTDEFGELRGAERCADDWDGDWESTVVHPETWREER